MLDFNAGKYAAFVWPAYALSVVVIGAMVADTLARARRWRRAAQAREAEAGDQKLLEQDSKPKLLGHDQAAAK